MNANVKKWVEALRSGKYRQGRGSLCSVNNKFCCLGVACDLYAAEHNGLWVIQAYRNAFTFDGKEGTLPPKVSKLLGMYDQDTLIDLNDSEELSFSEIADYIESHPELFEEQI